MQERLLLAQVVLFCCAPSFVVFIRSPVVDWRVATGFFCNRFTLSPPTGELTMTKEKNNMDNFYPLMVADIYEVVSDNWNKL